MQSGGVVSNTEAGVGYNSGTTGVVNIGVGSQWNNSRSLLIGVYGAGTMNVQNGGVVTSTDSYLGYLSGSTGTAMVDGAGSQWNNTSLDIGGGKPPFAGGTGNLTVSNSGRGECRRRDQALERRHADAQRWLADHGLVRPHAGHVQLQRWHAHGQRRRLHAGDRRWSSAAIRPCTAHARPLGQHDDHQRYSIRRHWQHEPRRLSITGGAVLSNPGNATALSTTYGGTTIYSGQGILGLNAGSSGTATVSGTTVSGTPSQWNNGSVLLVGYAGNGTLNVQSGGVVSNTEAGVGSTRARRASPRSRGPAPNGIIAVACSSALTAPAR